MGTSLAGGDLASAATDIRGAEGDEAFGKQAARPVPSRCPWHLPLRQGSAVSALPAASGWHRDQGSCSAGRAPGKWCTLPCTGGTCQRPGSSGLGDFSSAVTPFPWGILEKGEGDLEAPAQRGGRRTGESPVGVLSGSQALCKCSWKESVPMFSSDFPWSQFHIFYVWSNVVFEHLDILSSQYF